LLGIVEEESIGDDDDCDDCDDDEVVGSEVGIAEG